MAKLLENFLETKECRRRLLLSYFQKVNEDNLKQNKKCCDNCVRSSSVLNKYKNHVEIDLEEDAKLLLRAVEYFNGKTGLIKPIQFLRGADTQFIKPHMKKSELYGKGQKESEVWWKALGRILLRKDLLEEKACQPFGGFRQSSSSFPVSVTCITEDGKTFLKNGAESLGIRLEPSEELTKHTKTKPQMVRKFNEHTPSSPQVKPTEPKTTIERTEAKKESESELKLQQCLYDALLRTRQTLSFDFHIMPYVVASTLALQELCRHKPKTTQDLIKLEGFNEAKVEKFGDAFIKTINEVLANFPEKNTDAQWEEAAAKSKAMSPSIGEKAISQNRVKSETNFQSFFDDGDDDIFENLNDTGAANLNISEMEHKNLQTSEESTSPELLKPGKSGIKQEDSQNSKYSLDGDMDLFENFVMPDTNPVQSEQSSEGALSKLLSSSRDSTANSKYHNHYDSWYKESNLKNPMKKVTSETGSRLACKVNTNKKIKYSSDNSSDDESDTEKERKKLSNRLLLNSNAKNAINKTIKKNSLFK